MRLGDPGDDRLSRDCTIIGLAGLTAVFGMGTGVAPPVWSPGMPAGGGQARRQAVDLWEKSGWSRRRRVFGVIVPAGWTSRRRRRISRRRCDGPVRRAADVSAADSRGLRILHPSDGLVPGGRAVAGLGWGRVGVVKRSAVRTGPLRRSPALHSRPIDLVVFQEPSSLEVTGNLVSEGASRLDAFSAYPIPTWLPGDAASATAGTPEVGPPQSSRTRGEAPQVSYAHGR